MLGNNIYVRVEYNLEKQMRTLKFWSPLQQKQYLKKWI